MYLGQGAAKLGKYTPPAAIPSPSGLNTSRPRYNTVQGRDVSSMSIRYITRLPASNVRAQAQASQ